jgi:Fur family transcriptional regulator, ferric uptake regulator
VGALERLCERRGLKLTEHRRIVLEVLEIATDHPCAREIHRRAARDHRIGLATVYRSLNSLAAAGVVVRQTFSDGKARYEGATPAPHEHLIDVATGQVLEVTEPQVAHLLQAVARDLGYRLVDYRLQLFGERRPS